MRIPSLDRHGVSLITVVAAITILSIAAAVFMQMSGSMLFAGSRIDQSLRGQQVLVGVAADIQRMDYSQIVSDVCNNKTAGEALPNNCLVSDKLQAYSSQTVPAAGMPALNILLNENGKISETGDACVSLVSCKLMGSNNMLELKLMAFWKDPDPKKGVVSRPTLLRRVRW